MKITTCLLMGLALVASYETKDRAERIRAGITIARAQCERWGDSRKGTLYRTTMKQVGAIVKMKANGERVNTIVRTVNVSWPTVYRVLARVKDGYIKAA